MDENKIDKTFLKYSIYSQLSDIIYKQHIKSYMPLNIVILGLQTLFLIISVLITIFTDLNWSKYMCVCNLVLLLIVVVNNYIHTKTWQKSKDRLKDVQLAIDAICEKDPEKAKLDYDRYFKAICPSAYIKSIDDSKNRK